MDLVSSFSVASKKNIVLLIGIMLTIICGSANNILYYKIAIPYENYPFFLVIYSSMFSVPVYWLIVAAIRFAPIAKWNNYLTVAMLQFPLWKFAVLGLLDSLQGILGFFSDSHVPGATQQLLLQLTIPITMTASFFILKTRYAIGQYIGALVIILGIIVDLIPDIAHPGSDLAPDSFFWLIVYLSSTIPFALSYTYKEIIFKDVDMNLFYLMAHDTNFQFLFNLLFSPIDAVPKIGSSSSLSDVYIDIYYGFLCFFGVNSLPGDDCAGTWFLMVEYAAFNIGINLCLLFLLQQDSAAFMFLAMTITVPIANICFSFEWVMGEYATPLSWYDVAALIIIVIGLLTYRFTSPNEEEKKKVPNTEKSIQEQEEKDPLLL